MRFALYCPFARSGAPARGPPGCSRVARPGPAGTIINGKIRNLANYGAFIEIEPGIDGLLHVSDMSWTEKISHPNEKYKKGDEVECVVLDIDQQKQRVGLGVKQLSED
ncbi:MAG: S1 RNA-binding domain-containing protein, partial [Rhodothermales bacterium]|nr:S1 RNA-binding domain-containing protein [Rhodothermales bacterium]